MVSRWRMALQELEYTIGYIPGKQNEIADEVNIKTSHRFVCRCGVPACIDGVFHSRHLLATGTIFDKRFYCVSHPQPYVI